MRFGVHLPRQGAVTLPEVDMPHVKKSKGVEDQENLGACNVDVRKSRSKIHRILQSSHLPQMLKRGRRRHRTLKKSKPPLPMDRTVVESSCSSIESTDVVRVQQTQGCTGAAAAPEPGRRRSISFQENDIVIAIPASSDYPEEVRLSLWGSPVEMFRDVRRNMREFRAEGRNWRNAVEEDVMPVCPKTGVRIHPAHLDGLN